MGIVTGSNAVMAPRRTRFHHFSILTALLQLESEQPISQHDRLQRRSASAVLLLL